MFIAQQRPRVDPQENTVAEGEPARFRCWVPGDPTARLIWKMKGNGPLPHGAQQHEGILNFPSSGPQHAGSYICTASDPEGRKPPVDSPVARLIIRPGKLLHLPASFVLRLPKLFWHEKNSLATISLNMFVFCLCCLVSCSYCFLLMKH